jgi:hypothetical protein
MDRIDHNSNTKDYFTQNWKRQLFLLTLFIILFGTGAILLGQDNNWDLRDYHFYNGYALLHPHLLTWNIMPAMVQTYINPFFDVLNYLLIATQKPKVTSFILGAISAVNCFIIYNIVSILLGKFSAPLRTIYSLLAVVIGATGSIGIGLVGTTTNDTKMTLLILIALYLLIKSIFIIRNRLKLIYILIAGFIVGLDVGFKLPAYTYALSLFIALLFSQKLERNHIKSCSLFIIAGGIGFLLANGYWMYFLYQHFQSPLFPYYNNFFQSPYAPFLSFKDPLYYPQHFFSLPFYVANGDVKFISDAGLRDYRLAIIYALSTIFLLKYIYTRVIANKNIPKQQEITPIKKAWWLTFIWFFASYITWFIGFTIYRYVLPLELMSGLIMIYIIIDIFKSNLIRLVLISLAVITFLITTIYPNWGRVPYGKEYFSITVPPLPSNSTILFLSAPLAYVIPFFPPNTRFIGMPFIRRSAMLTEKVLISLKSPLYALKFYSQDDAESQKAKIILKQHGISFTLGICIKLLPNVGEALLLCPLKQLSR